MTDHRALLRRCFDASLEAVRPQTVLARHLRLESGGIVFVRGTQRAMVTYPDRAVGGRLRLMAFGKAAARFANALIEAMPGLVDDGLVVVKEGHAEVVPHCRVIEAAHPVPDARSEAAGDAVLRFAAQARPIDRHIVLLSGGASALVVAPVEGVTLQEKISLTQSLLRGGASIATLNAERKKRSRIKGGKLAELLGHSASLVLAISDVEGDDLSVIASGPMFGDARASHALVATADDALAAFAAQAEREGCRVLSLGRSMYGDIDACLALFTDALRNLHGEGAVGGAPRLLLAAGEPTLTVRGDGLGGRCQHFALKMACELAGDSRTTVLAAGTDGTDGPTAATGAIVDGRSWERMARTGIDPLRHWANHDSHAALLAGGELLVTGPTGTNVADLYAALVR